MAKKTASSTSRVDKKRSTTSTAQPKAAQKKRPTKRVKESATRTNPSRKPKGGNTPSKNSKSKDARHVGLVPAELRFTPNEAEAKKLPPNLRTSFDSLVQISDEAESIAADAHDGVRMKCYELGQEVNQVLEAAAETGEIDTNVKLLASALGVDKPRHLRNAGNVAATISSKEFDSLCSHQAVSWSHLVLLAKVAKRDKRGQLASEADERNWGVRELADAIRDESPKSVPRGPGRSRGIPSSPQTALRQMGKDFKRVEESFDGIYFGKRFDVAKEVGKLKVDDISDALREEANAALKRAEALQAKLPEFVEQIHNVVQQMDKESENAGGDAKSARGKQRRGS